MTKCAISVSVPQTGRRCGPSNLLISFSAADNTARFPFLAGDEFLGTLGKLLNTNISFVISARLSVCMEQLGSQWRNFIKFILGFF